jgi:hypothetical protein
VSAIELIAQYLIYGSFFALVVGCYVGFAIIVGKFLRGR